MKSDFSGFKQRVMGYYRRYGRHELPWRKTLDPYAILVSEVMLQQTQVGRVIPYYEVFIRRFPTFKTLAGARTSDVLKAWQGLGYNRRALMLQRCAKVMAAEYGGVLPNNIEELKRLPGLGPYTAGAVMVFALNQPHPLIETNIRRTYIHHFFPGSRSVPDDRLMPLIEKTMNRRNPRMWFSALMDYGSWLASQMPNPNRRSRHYTRQSRFEGSDRQIRGAVLKILLARPLSESALAGRFDISKRRFQQILGGLKREGFVRSRNRKLTCA